jgi:mannose-6-phosphate isomerase-like protein (cupin superfamily)
MIMTRCDDPLNPSRKGAVLKWTNRLSRALLDTGCITSPVTLEGEQEIFYFVEGTGEISGGGETFAVRDGILALVPEGLEFTLKNTGTEPLVMYLISEIVPDGFRPNETILVRDEYTTPYRNNNSYLTAHWIHNGKGIFTIQDGLSSLSAVNIGTMNAMTIGHAHSHDSSVEEVWTLIKGNDLEQLGREIRWIEPGTAFMIPPTGETPHSHINPTKEPVKFLLFARWGDRPRRP